MSLQSVCVGRYRYGVGIGVSLVALFFFSSASWAENRIYETKSILEDGIHDPTNEAAKIFQEPGEAMVDFPMDKNGLIDWVKAIQQGYVNPRKSKNGEEFGGKEVMQEMDMDIIMEQTASMPHVRFPHLAHTQWLACSNCHSEIFIPQKDANPVSMEKILKGEYCGRCHDKVSFPIFNCERCHSVPHDGAKAWW